MGFRFQKRIKISKGLGLNISKSGFSPSYRTKRGSVSSKGYSIKTGIPGLTYRNAFKKGQKSGCIIIVALCVLMTFSVVTVSCINEKQKKTEKWYQGGTLHKAKIVDWKNASDRNKLATCGDFLAKKYNASSLAKIKLRAENLQICIDEAVFGHTYSDESEVASVASLCMVLMEY